MLESTSDSRRGTAEQSCACRPVLPPCVCVLGFPYGAAIGTPVLSLWGPASVWRRTSSRCGDGLVVWCGPHLPNEAEGRSRDPLSCGALR
ncbi:hypothetical protein HMPREF0970_00008 [Schaalia odontolytica F0309]|uniref:Uncharacterized protein n=1 Tax=Schaalia odontolytica F0309 TaxID=649742 RepID=D4TVQ6_9ACTO|nr:hypothetical protein HMPREF0970_00008 [Schaalia odontolytica F0309]